VEATSTQAIGECVACSGQKLADGSCDGLYSLGQSKFGTEVWAKCRPRRVRDGREAMRYRATLCGAVTEDLQLPALISSLPEELVLRVEDFLAHDAPTRTRERTYARMRPCARLGFILLEFFQNSTSLQIFCRPAESLERSPKSQSVLVADLHKIVTLVYGVEETANARFTAAITSMFGLKTMYLSPYWDLVMGWDNWRDTGPSINKVAPDLLVLSEWDRGDWPMFKATALHALVEDRMERQYPTVITFRSTEKALSYRSPEERTFFERIKVWQPS
jgi:hypothetical protein